MNTNNHQCKSCSKVFRNGSSLSSHKYRFHRNGSANSSRVESYYKTKYYSVKNQELDNTESENDLYEKSSSEFSYDKTKKR